MMVTAPKYFLALFIFWGAWMPFPSWAQPTPTPSGDTVATSPASNSRWASLPLTPEQRNAAAKALSTYVRNGQASKEVAADFLAFALALDPACKEAVVGNFQISHGSFKPVASPAPPAELAKTLVGIADKLKGSPHPDAALLRTHLYYAATLIDPADENAIVGYEEMRTSKIALNWEAFYTETSYRIPAPEAGSRRARLGSAGAPPPPVAVPAAPPAPPAQTKLTQSKLKGLIMSDLGDGKTFGKVIEMTATTTTGSQEPIIANRMVPPLMSLSLKRSYSQLMALHPTWVPSIMKINFDEHIRVKDTSSCAVVFAVLLTSVQEGIELDPEVALTGNLSEDQVIRPIGEMHEKLMAAITESCSYVGIPTKNTTDVVDALIIDSQAEKICTKIQILTLDHLSDATALAQKDRPPQLQVALDLFKALQPSLTGKAKLPVDQVAQLEEILKQAPNHFTAKLLLQRHRGELPRTISLRASLREVDILVDSFNEQRRHSKTNNTFDFDPLFYQTVFEQINQIKPAVHKDVTPLLFRYDNFVRLWRGLAFKIKNDPAAAGSIRANLRSLNEEIDKFNSDLKRLLTDEKKASEIID